MKIKLEITTRSVVLIVILIVIIVAVVGGRILSRPIIKEVRLQPCAWATSGLRCMDCLHSQVCDQDGNFIYAQGGFNGSGSASTLGREKEDFSLSILKNRLYFMFKKYLLRVEDKDLLDSITQIKVVNVEEEK